MDWIAERNLDQEDEYERIKAEAGAGGSAQPMKNMQGGIDVVNNPNLHVPDRPDWFACAAEMKRDIASGKIVMEHIGAPAKPRVTAMTG